MSLYRDSRYADPATSRDVTLIKSDGMQVRTLFRRPAYTGSFNITHYVWRAGDRIDRVSYLYLGDPQKYWQILDLNPEILDANQIEPGTTIRIPHA
jgi:hypothetical protein